MSLQEGIELNIVQAEWIAGLMLKIEFSDGFSRSVDFEPFLSSSDLPVICAYLNVERFKGFSINYGNLVWNDYDLYFSIEDLYLGNLRATADSERLVAEDSPEYGE